MESILNTIKGMLGPTAEYTRFDPDIIAHINTALADLNQIGVGPEEGFFIEDETSTWGDFIDPTSLKFESVKSYIYMRVKLLFDPPTSSAVIESYNRQIEKCEWRLSVAADELNLKS